MEKYFRIISENLMINESNRILVNFYGEEENREEYIKFLSVLETKYSRVKGVFFDKKKVIEECNQNIFSLGSVYHDYPFRDATIIF